MSWGNYIVIGAVALLICWIVGVCMAAMDEQDEYDKQYKADEQANKDVDALILAADKAVAARPRVRAHSEFFTNEANK